VYDGNFVNDLPEGLGTLSMPTGKYTGEFKRGTPNGYGKMVFSNGDVYEGTILQSIFDFFFKANLKTFCSKE
jgi:hypothetical protein